LSNYSDHLLSLLVWAYVFVRGVLIHTPHWSFYDDALYKSAINLLILTYCCECWCGCTDVDECVINNGGCQYACENTAGSFVCTCPPGYLLDADRRHCIGTASHYHHARPITTDPDCSPPVRDSTDPNPKPNPTNPNSDSNPNLRNSGPPKWWTFGKSGRYPAP